MSTPSGGSRLPSTLPLKLDKLPLTAQVLAEVVENREKFAVGQVEYAAEHFRQENVCLQQWQLVRRAGLRPDIKAAQQMKESLDPLGKNSSV